MDDRGNPDRHAAGTMTADRFASEVHRAFAYLVDELGFEAHVGGDYELRFENGAVRVAVGYDESRSREIAVWIDDGRSAEPPLALADALSATAAGAGERSGVELMQASDPEAVARLLARAAGGLRSHGRPFLEGRAEAFAAARALRSGRARDYTSRIASRPTLEAADRAWERRDFREVRDLLDPIRDTLDATHRRRLELAERRA